MESTASRFSVASTTSSSKMVTKAGRDVGPLGVNMRGKSLGSKSRPAVKQERTEHTKEDIIIWEKHGRRVDYILQGTLRMTEALS